MKPKISIEPVTALRIRYQTKTYSNYITHPMVTRRYKTVRTLKQAADRVAWWMLGDRFKVGLDSVTDVAGYECSCEQPDGPYATGSSVCEIHNRQTGYFRRAHDKLAAILLKQWEGKP